MTNSPSDPPTPPMHLWEKFWRTDPDDTKDLTFGAKLTSVGFYPRLKMMTEQFGPCGDGWGWKTRFERFSLPTNEIMVECHLELWIKGHTSTISTVGTAYLYEKTYDKKKKEHVFKVNPNAPKSAQTSATAKAFSMLGMNYDIYSDMWSPAHAEEMREHFRSKKAFAHCPHLSVPETLVRSSWDMVDCMRATSEMARCVTTHMSWFSHHLTTTKPDWLTAGKPNSKVTFPYCRNLFLKVQRRTGLLHKLMQAYTDRHHWLQTLEVMGAEDPFVLTDKKFDALLKRIRADVSGIDADTDAAIKEGLEESGEEEPVEG